MKRKKSANENNQIDKEKSRELMDKATTRKQNKRCDFKKLMLKPEEINIKISIEI